MTEHLTPLLINSYCERSLTPDERIQFDRHVAVCDGCREEVCRVENIDGELRAFIAGLEIECLDEDDHLESAQIVAYLKDEMDEVERIIAESHMEVCEMCARETCELKSYIEEITPVAQSEAHSLKAPLWMASFNFWKGSNASRLGYAAAFAALVIVALTIFTLRERREAVPFQAEQASNTSQVTQNHGTQNNSIPAPTPLLPMTKNTPEQSAKGHEASGPVRDRQHSKSLNSRALPVTPSTPNRSSSTAETKLVLIDGDRQVTLNGSGRISGLGEMSRELQSSIAAALKNGHVETNALMDVTSYPSVTLKGATRDAEFRVTSPVGTLVKSDRPIFRWEGVQGATGYTVTVVKRGQIQVATSELLTDTEWQPSVGQLQPGIVYRWGVVAKLSDGTEVSAPGAVAPEARFKVMEPERVEGIEQLARRYSQSPLTLGVLYAREGLIDDAEKEFKRLVRKNPRSRTARRLLANLRGLRTITGRWP